MRIVDELNDKYLMQFIYHISLTELNCVFHILTTPLMIEKFNITRTMCMKKMIDFHVSL